VADVVAKSELDMLKEKFEAHKMGMESAIEEMGAEVSEMHEEIHGIQESVAGLKSSMDSGGQSLSAANMENANAIAALNKSLMGHGDKFKAHVKTMEAAHMEHAEHTDGHLGNIEKTLAGMKAVQDDTAGKVDKILNPPKMKSKKRPLAFLTALVGGAALVAMNSLGDRE
ncbi:MAG: hypothetical protein OXI86_12485, partial [Candidatus Poribacteria bacterium]|nr:hypothetical protein [Candidatus Poribacteria bacterium]